MHMYIDYNRICENYIGEIREFMTFFLILVITHIKKKGLIFPFQFLKPNHFCNILMNKLIFPKKNMYLVHPYIYWIKVTRGWQINRQRRFVKYNKMGRALLHNCSLRNFIYCPHFSGYENLTMFCHDLVRSFLNISENREISLLVSNKTCWLTFTVRLCFTFVKYFYLFAPTRDLPSPLLTPPTPSPLPV